MTTTQILSDSNKKYLPGIDNFRLSMMSYDLDLAMKIPEELPSFFDRDLKECEQALIFYKASKLKSKEERLSFIPVLLKALRAHPKDGYLSKHDFESIQKSVGVEINTTLYILHALRKISLLELTLLLEKLGAPEVAGILENTERTVRKRREKDIRYDLPESTIEKIILKASKSKEGLRELQNRGLPVVRELLPQLTLGEDGRMDLCEIHVNEDDHHATITIYELKSKIISIATLRQGLRYVSGVKKMLLESNAKITGLSINLFLIGESCRDFDMPKIKTPELKSIKIYTYTFGIDGFQFEEKINAQ